MDWPTHCIHGNPISEGYWCPKCKAIGSTKEKTMPKSVPEAVDPIKNKPPSGSREERIDAINKQIDELCKQREAVMNEEAV
jgi:hypothetical protein